MTSDTARANAEQHRAEARVRLYELVRRDIKEAADAEGLFTSDLLQTLAGVVVDILRVHSSNHETRQEVLDVFSEVVEQLIAQA